MNGVLFLHALAAHLAWMEGREYGINGQLAILFCLRNRVSAGWEEGDLGRIIQGIHYLRYGEHKDLIEVPDIRDPSFQQLLSYVQGVFDNSIQDVLTSGALYWGEKPDRGFRTATRVAQVGSLLLWL